MDSVLGYTAMMAGLRQGCWPMASAADEPMLARDRHQDGYRNKGTDIGTTGRIKCKHNSHAEGCTAHIDTQVHNKMCGMSSSVS